MVEVKPIIYLLEQIISERYIYHMSVVIMNQLCEVSKNRHKQIYQPIPIKHDLNFHSPMESLVKL